MRDNTGSIKLLLALVILLGLGTRLFWGLRQSDDLSSLPDQKEYLDLGNHLWAHQGLWLSDARFGDVVYAYRMPGYPLMIAACQGSPRIVRVVQAFLDASTILAVFLLAGQWLSPRGALLAAALVAVNPYMIYFSGTILTETLFTAMLVWGMTFVVSSGGPWPVGWEKMEAWLRGALLLALTVLVRPGAFLLPVFLGIGAALLMPRDGAAQRKRWPLPVASTMLLLTFLVLFPWAVRNHDRLGSWIWTSTNAGITRYDGFNPDARGDSDQSFTQRMPWLASMNETGRSEYLGEKADDFISEHPRRAMELGVIKIARTWSPVPLSSEFGSRWMYVAIGVIYGGALDILILVGLWRGNLSGTAKRYLLLPAVYFTVAAALSVDRFVIASPLKRRWLS